jgi:hypothetical protein
MINIFLQQRQDLVSVVKMNILPIFILNMIGVFNYKSLLFFSIKASQDMINIMRKLHCMMEIRVFAKLESNSMCL